MSHAPCRNAAASSFKPLLPSSGSRLRAKPTASSSSRRSVSASASSRRDFLLLVPSLAAAASILRPLPSSAASNDGAPPPPPAESSSPSPPPPEAAVEEHDGDESAMSRVYDATVIGEPEAVGSEKMGRVWEKLTAARVVYLGEAELVPDPDDRVLELEIVRGLASRCAEAERGLALALEAFPCDLQQQLDQFMDGRL